VRPPQVRFVYLVIMDQIRIFCGSTRRQEHVHAGPGQYGLGIAPKPCNETFGKRPQNTTGDCPCPRSLVAQSIRLSTAVMVDHPLGLP